MAVGDMLALSVAERLYGREGGTGPNGGGNGGQQVRQGVEGVFRRNHPGGAIGKSFA
jgi:hypothetical protein